MSHPTMAMKSSDPVDSPNRSRRLISSSGSRTKVELHQVDVQLQKEIDRLERLQNAAVNNIANHQQAMKMSWRKLEQKRSSESPLLSRSKGKDTSSTPDHRRGMFYSNTKLHASAGVNVWRDDSAPPPTNVSPLVVTVSGDVHHRRVSRDHGPPPSSSTRSRSSPFLSSPYNLRKPNPLQSKALLLTNGSKSGSELGLPGASGSNSDTSDKDTLLKASKLMGVESVSQGPNSFKEFYSSSGGVERSKSAASILVSSALDQSINAKSQEAEKEDNSEAITQAPDGELTMAQMFDQIKHCRYIRRYHPDGTALEEYF